MMGQSAGRSARNRKSEQASRRATPREREGIDPPQFEEFQHMDLLTEKQHRRERIVEALAWGLWTFASVFIAVLVLAWFGAI